MYLQKLKQNRQQGCRQYGSRQQGFVLILALVMLAVLTLIGVSSMNSANMELKATANAQQHQIAFEGVQSMLEFAISKTGSSAIDFQTNDPTPQVVTTTLANASSLSASAVYGGCSVGVGSSLEEGKGFSYNFFNITATGSNETAAGTKGTATSIQTQGIRYPAAACAD
jgi:type IV pilus assembly protein PilX